MLDIPTLGCCSDERCKLPVNVQFCIQTALDGQPSKGDQCGRDWSVMGFQRSDAPQSDFRLETGADRGRVYSSASFQCLWHLTLTARLCRGCGLLALHCLVFFCKEFTEEVRALLSAQVHAVKNSTITVYSVLLS